MTEAERKFLYSFSNSIREAMLEEHYMLHFDEEKEEFIFVLRTATNCNTRHALTKKEVLRWYYSELNNDDSNLLRNFSNYYDLEYDYFLFKLKEIIKKYLRIYPEYFV